MENAELFNFAYQLVTEPLFASELEIFNEVKERFIEDMLTFTVGKHQSWDYRDAVVGFDVFREYYVTTIVIKTCDRY